MRIIDINKPIKKIVDEYPEVREIMVSLGFKHIANAAMLNTVGRFVTIKEGAKMQKIDMDLVESTFKENNFILEKTNE